MRLAILALIALIAGPALAQSFEDGVDIPLNEWRALAQGRTVTYRIEGNLYARERYAPSGNRVAIELANGECLDGTWSHRDNQFCFAWDSGEFSCFRHIRLGREILIVHMDGDEPSGDIQEMTDISDVPLTCTPSVTS